MTWDSARSMRASSSPPGARMSSRAMASGSACFTVTVFKLVPSFSRVVDHPVFERREARAGVHARRGIDVRHDAAGATRHACQYLAPVIDDHRVTEGLAPARVNAPLRRRDQAAEVLDGARAQ